MKRISPIEALKTRRLYFDGGTGTVLQSMGLPAGMPPESMLFSAPEAVERLHREYFLAGADIIKTNTFGINSLKYENYSEYINKALEVANNARRDFPDKYVALDIGPLGRMLAPFGDLDFEDAVEIFSKTLRAAEGLGADLILIETMTDIYEMKAAIVAAKECSSLPIFATVVFDESGKLLTGADADAVVSVLEGLGVSALGVNCSLGPNKLLPIVSRICKISSTPVIVNPNAGLPVVRGGEACFDISDGEFASYMSRMASLGCAVLGGCCGTTPEYIRKTREATENIPYTYPEKKNICTISSYTHALTVGDTPIIIGERINPTGKPKLKDALRRADVSYILTEAISEEESGAHALDVNVGLPEIDEISMMRRAVYEIQAVSALPLQIDSSSPEVLEGAMRIYNGKPLVNSVNGKRESMNAVFPLVKKYGGAVIALTMDEDGIPADIDGRVKIAEKILAEAAKYGIGKSDIIFDPLAMAISSDKNAASVTLGTVKVLSDMGCLTSLGVSNVSFGLPMRDAINASFFTAALCAGLDAAIINPHSAAMMDAYRAFVALSGKDENLTQYIAYAASRSADASTSAPKSAPTDEKTLKKAIIKGLKADAVALCEACLVDTSALEVVNREIIPALAEVGDRFESGRAYLPELLMSAEAANAAFEIVKVHIPREENEKNGKIILATVKGDIHDIGKNIVKTVLESYGYDVIDLGRDVAPDAICRAAVENGVRLVGLSALMTTTVPAMSETVELIKGECPDCAVMVGGAVLNEEYAAMMGAHYYAKDAMSAVKIAKEIFG